jgi:hypothetical protein
MSNLYREPSIDASYQVSIQLAKQFLRKRFLEIDRSEARIACGSHVCSRKQYFLSKSCYDQESTTIAYE